MKKLIEKELAFFSSLLVRKFRPFVIGVTGSSGKTTTKFFIAELLARAGVSVLVSPGNLNTKTGIPLAILGFRRAPKNWYEWLAVIIFTPFKATFTFRFEKFLILEYAIDLPGDMDKVVSIARPDITVITNISDAHIEIFKTREQIAIEKWKLAEAAKEAVVVSQHTLETIKGFELKKVSSGLFILPSIKYAKAENISYQSNKTTFDLYLANKKYETHFKFFGKHNVENLELAIFAAHLATADDDLIVSAIPELAPLKGRGQRIQGKKSTLIIDESYNANPSSMTAALETLSNIKHGRKVSILGQMAEIGPISDESHRQLAKTAKKKSDFTIGVGEAFKEAGLDIWYEDVSKLIQEVDGIVKEGDVVLVKGSRSNELDRLVDYLEVK